MPTQGTKEKRSFPPLSSRRLEMTFDGGQITTDGGTPLLCEVDESLGLTARFAKGCADHRNPDRTEHDLIHPLRQRIEKAEKRPEMKENSEGDVPLDRIVLDLDATDDPLHGEQEGIFITATVGITATYYCVNAHSWYGSAISKPEIQACHPDSSRGQVFEQRRDKSEAL